MSHSSRDRWIAQQIARCLGLLAGVEVFLDEKDLQGGDRVDQTVKDGIKRCDELVVIFSSASMQSDWVKAEIGAAWGLDKRVVVLLEKLTKKDVPDLLSQHKMVDLNEVQAYFDQVAVRAKRGK